MLGDSTQLDIGWRTAAMLAAIAPALLVALRLAFREVETHACRWLAAFVLAAVANMTPQVIGFANFYDVWPGLSFLPVTTTLLLGPLIYLHADQLMRGGSLRWRWWLLLPGALQLAYYAWAFFSLGDSLVDHQRKWAFAERVHQPYVVPIETALAVGLMLFAMIAVHHQLHDYRRFLQRTQSANDTFRPVWLPRLFYGLSGAGLIWAVMAVIETFVTPLSYVSAYPILLTLMLLISWLGLEAVIRIQERFPKMRAEPVTQADVEPRDWAAEGKQIRARIEAERWYLEPRLAVSDLSRRLGSNESYVSRALNQGLNSSFSALINQLRVKHAQAQLAATGESVLTIALESGFNSKATFNRVFREISGITPSAFRSQSR